MGRKKKKKKRVIKCRKKAPAGETRPRHYDEMPTPPGFPSIESTSDGEEWLLLEQYMQDLAGEEGGDTDETASLQMKRERVNVREDAILDLTELPAVDFLFGNIAGDFNLDMPSADVQGTADIMRDQ